ncbi:hypothetical protein PRIPAC_73920 [Pristionchus pacificus]|uniref:Uncharacterized protein n=1 Tax=Pristionchus pacificus TaxID=54126 RepID=A0A2A6C109_PRIPA|nr:hypothetical protein PRIPAC_73920 [Pristionchus pacificus]|eukprot:PDM71854.1 hypothetical protein PRIPAC_38261 [Pristionchus pacificus]
MVDPTLHNFRHRSSAGPQTPTGKHFIFHGVRHAEAKSRSRRLVPSDSQSRDHQLLLAKPHWPWP